MSNVFNCVVGFLTSGLGATILLLLGFLVETVILLMKDLTYALNEFSREEGNIVNEVERYASKSLTFASITFAGVSFIIAQHSDSISVVSDSLFLFVSGLAFFLISYKFEVFGPTKRIAWNIQQRLFNYGILSLVYGLLLFFHHSFPPLVIPMIVMGLLILIIHILEYVGDFQDFGRQSHQSTLQEYV